MLQEEYIALYGDPRPQPADGRPIDPDELPLCATDDERKACQAVEAAEKEQKDVETARQRAEAAREKAWIRQIHERAKRGDGRSALALSGGGIRSATFALGVLQGLARAKLLTCFDYLSTVSGGGYLGSWLSAWLHRERGSETRGGVDEVFEQLSRSAGAGRDTIALKDAATTRAGPEPVEVRHLREYSNYLTPRVGLLRPDGWTLAATYFRNLLLNWVVMLPLLTAFVLLPRVYLSALKCVGQWTTLGVHSGWRTVVLCLLSIPSIVALVALISGLPSVNRTPPMRSARGHQRHDDEEDDDAPAGNVAEEAPRQMDTSYVLALIIFPMLLSAFLGSFARIWLVAPAEPWYMFWNFYLGFYGGYYCFAAILVALITRFRRRPSPPPTLPLMLAMTVAGVITGAVLTWTRTWPVMTHIGDDDAASALYAMLVGPSMLGAFLLWLTLYVGLSSGRPCGDEDREWLARISAWTALIIFLWVTGCAVGLGGPILWHYLAAGTFEAKVWGWITGGMSVVTTVLGLLGGHSPSSAAPAYSRPSRSLGERIRHSLPALAAPIAVILILLILATGAAAFSEWMRNEADPLGMLGKVSPDGVRLSYDVLLIVCLAAIGTVAGLFMNSNRLSFHAVYRDRLIRAFLGASNRNRQPNPFTGFDPHDNVPLHHLRRGQHFTRSDLVEESENEQSAKKYWRLHGVGQMLRARKEPFVDWLWKRATRKDSRLNDLFEKSDTPGKEAVEPMLDALNLLLGDPDLFAHSPFADDEQRHKPHNRDIDWAYRRVADDGCCHLLNRLILEETFAVKLPALDSDSPERPRKKYFLKADHGSPQIPRPMHIVNVALNLVAGENLAWQQRKAAAFTFSPLHSGFEIPAADCRRGGYRRSVEYGSGISLGTTMTISGAAATPNMGYHSTPAVTFLMALFNVRLGLWLGNTGDVPDNLFRRAIARAFRPLGLELTAKAVGAGTEYRRAGPLHSLVPLINETLGQTTDQYRYIYLSDGGHFENLGLYEMVRRRCHTIVVSDASCDPDSDFEDFGNAIRKIQIDLGIPIELRQLMFFPKPVRRMKDGKYCAVAEIDYAAVDGPDAPKGTLIYLKPARHVGEPVDVFNYAETNPAFPHDPTANQWFNESQFESYRKLGLETVRILCGSREELDLPAFVNLARDHLGAKAAQKEEAETSGVAGRPGDEKASDAAAGPRAAPDPQKLAEALTPSGVGMVDPSNVDEQRRAAVESRIDAKSGSIESSAGSSDAQAPAVPPDPERQALIDLHIVVKNQIGDGDAPSKSAAGKRRRKNRTD
jgi:hypothetical protein